MWVEHQTDPDGPPFRPTGVVQASVWTGLVHLDLANGDEPATADLALASFLSSNEVGKACGPARVEVRIPVCATLWRGRWPHSTPRWALAEELARGA